MVSRRHWLLLGIYVLRYSLSRDQLKVWSFFLGRPEHRRTDPRLRLAEAWARAEVDALRFVPEPMLREIMLTVSTATYKAGETVLRVDAPATFATIVFEGQLCVPPVPGDGFAFSEYSDSSLYIDCSSPYI